MRGASQAALAAATKRLEPVLASTDGRVLGEELFTVVDLLDANGSIRRGLTDPARPGEDKAALVAALLGGKMSEEAVDLVSGMARDRWSADVDLADALEHVATGAILADAQAKGTLEDVEDAVFRLSRNLIGQRDLRSALTDRSRSADDRARLLGDLLAGKVDDHALVLLQRAVHSLRDGQLTESFSRISALAAELRDRMLALVTAAVPLTSAQQDRLAGILQRAYGRQVDLKVAVDPAVLGGARITIGSDVIDGTVASRLADVKSRLTGN